MSRLRPPPPKKNAYQREQPGEHREEPGERHDQHVAVRDVRELVREHALDLARLEPAPEAGRDRDGGVLRVAPVANAFGTSLSITATFGFGRSAIAASRSTIACSSGASCSETIFAPDAFSASLSEV